MELFYSKYLIAEPGQEASLSEEESLHCIKVLRHKTADEISVIDGKGNLCLCTITGTTGKKCTFEVNSITCGWGGHAYRLCVACAPTKNPDRFEWFAEKATEMGIDSIVPIICEHSERRVIKNERLERVVVSAVKQSLKGYVPELHEAIPSHEFIRQASSFGGLKLIAYCFESEDTPRRSMFSVISDYLKECSGIPQIAIMIGPEGDFSIQEARQAISAGFIPVIIGDSRLRTETAALAATAAVYSLVNLG